MSLTLPITHREPRGAEFGRNLTLGALAGLVAALAVLPALLTARSRPAELTATPTLSR